MGNRRQARSIGAATSWKLFDNNLAAGDAMPGWIVQLDDGHSETIGATAGPDSLGFVRFRRAGDTTSGPITLRGKPGFATRPILTFANNYYAVYLFSNYTQIIGLELQNSNVTKTSSVGVYIANGFINRVIDIKIAHSTNNFWKGVLAGGVGFLVRDCEIGHTASHGIEGTGNIVHLRNNYIHNCGGDALYQSVDPTILTVRDSIIANNAAGLVLVTMSGATSRHIDVSNNTFYNNTGVAVDLQFANDGINHLRISNNIIQGGTHGIKFSAAGATNTLLATEGVLVAGNNTYGISTAAYLSADGTYTNANCPWATNDPGLDPQFADAAGGNFAIGTNLKAQGYPQTNIGMSATRSYIDPGVAQRQEATGAVASSYTVTPTSTTEVVGSPVTIAVTPGGTYTGTITPSSADGTFSPTSLSWSAASDMKSFTYTPVSTGSKTVALASSPQLGSDPTVTVTASAASGTYIWPGVLIGG